MKQPLSTPNAMVKHTIFAATTVGKSFCPRLSVQSWRANQDAAVNKNTANEGVITAGASQIAVRVICTGGPRTMTTRTYNQRIVSNVLFSLSQFHRWHYSVCSRRGDA
jgi:hypothetical protein